MGTMGLMETSFKKYKESKAFSFDSTSLVKEVMVKQLSDSLCLSETCINRYTKVNEPPQRTWVCTSNPSGDIL